MAIDLNVFSRDGTLVNSSIGGSPAVNKRIWENTNLPRIAMGPPLFLRWGGNFSKYDPVHFDFNPPDWGSEEQTLEYFDKLMDKNLDTVATGGLTEREADEQERLKNLQTLGTYVSDDDTPAEIKAARKSATED